MLIILLRFIKVVDFQVLFLGYSIYTNFCLEYFKNTWSLIFLVLLMAKVHEIMESCLIFLTFGKHEIVCFNFFAFYSRIDLNSFIAYWKHLWFILLHLLLLQNTEFHKFLLFSVPWDKWWFFTLSICFNFCITWNCLSILYSPENDIQRILSIFLWFVNIILGALNSFFLSCSCKSDLISFHL